MTNAAPAKARSARPRFNYKELGVDEVRVEDARAWEELSSRISKNHPPMPNRAQTGETISLLARFLHIPESELASRITMVNLTDAQMFMTNLCIRLAAGLNNRGPLDS
jgi:hypothetical protein